MNARIRFGVSATALFASTLLVATAANAQSACSGDNGGITLSPGFCATIFADSLGHVRQMAVAPNGVLYVNTWSGVYYNNDTPHAGGFLVALQDTKDSGQADKIDRFGPTAADGDKGGTGLAIYKNYVYAETNDRIVRYALPAQGIAPTAAPETVVSGLPVTGDHPMHPFAIDARGDMYVDLGSATNACQGENRMPGVPGEKPCNELKTRAGTWLYDANRLDQHFLPAQRFATGIRNGEGFSFDSTGRLYVTQHGRDQLYENWPKLYNAAEGQNEPAEELVQLRRGGDYGWPECYYDYTQKKLVLAPEYGGDGGKTVGVCAQKLEPAAAFPAHWAPDDMKVYEGTAFPSAYKDGAFLAFHGSWNRAPGPQGGYNVVFQPMHDGKASGPFVVFADGFAGAIKQPGRAAHRPTGLAIGPDGTLYISDDYAGRIWRVTFHGDKESGIAAAPAPRVTEASNAATAVPPEGVHPNAGEPPLPIPPGASPDQVALGDRIFHGQVDGGTCAGCHSPDGKGSAIGSDLADGHFIWSNGSVESIEQTIMHGVPKAKEHIGAMPPEGGAQLSQADLAAVADYVWAISHRNKQ
jgi:glucose/arabinose dehydrogenase